MSVTSGFYNSLNGDRKYDARQMAAIFDGIINDGIYMSIGTCMVVKATTGLTVSVGAGRAWFNQTWTLNDSELLLTLQPADLLLNRIDAVVLEVDARDSTRANSIKVITGTPASEPARPTLSKQDGLYQYALAYIYVAKEATSVTTSNITNMVGTSEAPYVTGIIQTINADNLIAQWESQWNDWKKAIETDNTNWTKEQREAWTVWVETQEDEFTNWKAAYMEDMVNFQDTTETNINEWYAVRQNEFNVWFESIKNNLSEDAIGNLQNDIDIINERLDQVVIKTKYKDTDIILNDGEPLPFTNEDMNEYHNIKSITVNGTKVSEFGDAIMYIFNTQTGSTQITAIAGHNKDANKTIYAGIIRSPAGLYTLIRDKSELTENKVTAITESSNDTQYPSAAAVRKFVNNSAGTNVVQGESLEVASTGYTINATVPEVEEPYSVCKQIGLIPKVLSRDSVYDPSTVNSDLLTSGIATASGTFSNPGNVLVNKTSTGSYAGATFSGTTGDPKTIILTLSEILYATQFQVYGRYIRSDSTLEVSGPDGTVKMTISGSTASSYNYLNFNLPTGTKTPFRVNKIIFTQSGYYSSSYSSYTRIVGLFVKGYNKTLNTSLPISLNINNKGARSLCNCPIKTEDNDKIFLLTYNTNNEYELVSDNGMNISKYLSVKQGTITHEGIIPKTAGYKNYIYMVSTNTTITTIEVADFRDHSHQIVCKVDQSTREVTIYSKSTCYKSSDQDWDGVANYIEIAWN